jgi:hypothetical protein
MRRLLCLAFVVWRANDQDSMNADDRLAKLRNDYQAFPEEKGLARSNAAYGWIRVKP